MDIRGTCKNFRIDHCKFKNSDGMIHIGGLGEGDTYGLIDHCYFDGQQSHGGNVQPIGYAGPGAANYRKPLSLGTARRCTSRTTRSISAPSPARAATGRATIPGSRPTTAPRVVIRHNKLVNSQMEIYSPGIGQGCTAASSARSTTMSSLRRAKGRPQGSVFIGAGRGMVFNNTVTGTTHNCAHHLAGEPAGIRRNDGAFGKADGNSPFDGNQIPAGQVGAGYPCMGQVGWATEPRGQRRLRVHRPCYCLEQHHRRQGAAHGGQRQGSERGGARSRKAGISSTRSRRQEYYKPYVYPHPLQEGWEALMKSRRRLCRLGFGQCSENGPLPESREVGPRSCRRHLDPIDRFADRPRLTGAPSQPVVENLGREPDYPIRTIKEYAARRAGLGDDGRKAVGFGGFFRAVLEPVVEGTHGLCMAPGGQHRAG